MGRVVCVILIADIHGAADALRKLVDESSEPILILGDLINFIDYRTMDGILADMVGREWVAELVHLRMEERFDEARARWAAVREGRESELNRRSSELIEDAYREIGAALRGADAVVTYGNVDRTEVLERYLPNGTEFVSYGIREVDGWTVGIVGGGVRSGLNVPGEVDEQVLADRLAALGPVDILCTHVPPAVPALQTDVVGATVKGSPAVLAYLKTHQPPFHYFGDIHQPQATDWRVGATQCRNVGYFRATGRGRRHPKRAGRRALA